mgnify:FL=1
MKRLIMTIIFSMSLLFDGVSVPMGNVVAVDSLPEYPQYLWDDDNYEFVHEYSGYGMYVDWSSAAIISNDPKNSGQIEFAVNILIVGMRNKNILKTLTYEYADDNKPGFLCRINEKEWEFYDPKESFGYDQSVMVTYNKFLSRFFKHKQKY